MQGKTQNIKTIRPLKDGVIADFDASEKWLVCLLKASLLWKKECLPSSKDGGLYSFWNYRWNESR
jgi:rod shape-determining protein MreB